VQSDPRCQAINGGSETGTDTSGSTDGSGIIDDGSTPGTETDGSETPSESSNTVINNVSTMTVAQGYQVLTQIHPLYGQMMYTVIAAISFGTLYL